MDPKLQQNLNQLADLMTKEGRSDDEIKKAAQAYAMDFGSQQKPATTAPDANDDKIAPKGFFGTSVGEGLVRETDNYFNQTPEQFAIQNSVETGAWAPVDINKLGTEEGVDAFVGTLGVVPRTAANFGSSAINAVKGLWGLARHPINTAKGLKEDPGALLGSGLKTLMMATTKVGSELKEGDIKGAAGAVGEGAVNTATAFLNDPFNSLVSIKGLGKVHKLVTEPRAVATKVTDTAKKTFTAITKPKESFAAKFPEIYKKYTQAGLNDFKTQIDNGIKERIDLLDQKSQLDKELGSLDSQTPLYRSTLSEIDAISDRIKQISEVQEGHLQMTAEALREGARVRSSGNIDGVYDALSTVTEKFTEQKNNLYDQTLGTVVPDYSSLISKFDEFAKKIDRQNDGRTAKFFDQYIDDFKARVKLNEMWDDSGKDAQFFTKMLFKPENAGLYDKGQEFLSDPSKFRLNDLDELKANAKSSLRSEVDKSPVTNTKKLFEDTIQRGIEETIEKSIKDRLGDNGVARYKEADRAYAISDSLQKKLKQDATDSTKEAAMMKNFDLIQQSAPVVADVVQNYFLRRLLEDSKTTRGYAPDKLLDGLEKYRNVLSTEDRMQVRELADGIAEARRGVDTEGRLLDEAEAELKLIEEKRKVVGENPVEIANNIGKIDTEASLKEFSDITGVKPEDLGKAWLHERLTANEKAYAKGDDYNAVIESLLKDVKKLGGNTSESASVRRQLLGDAEPVIKELEGYLKKAEELDATTASSLPVRAVKLVAAPLIFIARQWWKSGVDLMMEGLKGPTREMLTVPRGYTVVDGKVSLDNPTLTREFMSKNSKAESDIKKIFKDVKKEKITKNDALKRLADTDYPEYVKESVFRILGQVKSGSFWKDAGAIGVVVADEEQD